MSSGYDFQTKDTTPDIYQCQICHLLIRNFTELPCDHSFCRECLLHWEKQKSEEEDKTSKK